MSAHSQPDSSGNSSTLAAGAMAAGIAMLLYSGRLDSSDEQMMAATAQSIATAASLKFPEMYGQTFTGYGVGTPLVGVPFVWIESLLGTGATIPALVLLANAVLLGLAVWLSGVIVQRLGWRSNWAPWTVAGIALASPALPLALRYYSDLLAGCGLLAMAGGLLLGQSRPRRWPDTMLLLGPAFALMARPSVLPLLLLVLVWGYGTKVRVTRLILPALGILAGLGIRALQNWALRGDPLNHGYEGQEFTTPLATGLHGLLFSPERGLFVFWPVALLLFFPPEGETSLARQWRILSLAVMGTSLALHSVFWTWHGGWTIGPRFLLPALILAIPSAVLGLRVWFLSPWLSARVTVSILWLWGLIINSIHSIFHAADAYRLVWNFHGVESRWLFEPQMSLLRWWGVLAADGAWYPVMARWIAGSGDLGRDGAFALGLGLMFLTGGIALLIAKSPLSTLSRQMFDTIELGRRWWMWCGVLVLLTGIGLSGLMRGERGVISHEGSSMAFVRIHGLAPGESHELDGLLDLAPHGDYRFHGRVRGAYQIRIDGVVVAEGTDGAVPRHLFEGQFSQSESGMRLLEVSLTAPEKETGVLELYWSWPGEGVLLEAVGGEYVLPQNLTAVERLATRIWRQRWVLLAFGVFVLVLADMRGKPRELQ